MKRDSRLSGVLHVLLHMSEQGAPMTSEQLARAMQTNPVVIRRILGGLRDAFMPLADRIGPVHRMMVKTMAGHERGLAFRKPLALPPP